MLVDSPPDGAFGSGVAISGTTAIVGKPERSVFAYTFSNGEWTEPQELVAGRSLSFERYGQSVAISGDTVIVGTPNDEEGTAQVFSRNGSSWTHMAELKGGAAAVVDHFGASVAIDGDVVVVGAPSADTAYVFARVGDRFIQQKQLRASDNPPPGYRNDFGAAVAISGRTVVVGAPHAGEPDPFLNAGKVYVYAMPSDLSGAWPETLLLPSARRTSEFFGRTLAISGGTVVVGAHRDDLNVEGTAYAFTKRGSRWEQQKFTSDSSFTSDWFGHAVAISGDRIAIGAPELQTEPRFYPGGVTTYVRAASGWVLEQELLGEVRNEFFGSGVGLTGDSMIVGASARVPGGIAYTYSFLGDVGGSCRTSTDCGLGHCVSGVCCENACDGACAECSTGKCRPVASGTTGAPSCHPRVCDGASKDCPTSCVADGGCVTTHYCRDAECTPKAREGDACQGPEECLSRNCVQRRCAGMRPNGSSCKEASDCTRGYCVDGVCCNDPCRQQCEACDVPEHEGECTAVEDAPHGDREPCAGDDAICRGRCDGVNIDTCSYAPSMSECDSTCENDEETVSTCDGHGACVRRDARSCLKFACAGSVRCSAICESDDDCSSGFSCWADGACDLAARCVSDHESESAPGGRFDECRPYACSNGSCRTTCGAPEDCAAPNVCDPNERRCVAAPSDDPEGCGCRAPARTGSRVSVVEVFLALLVLARRRARRRLPRGNP